jgi:hypothetical protein
VGRQNADLLGKWAFSVFAGIAVGCSLTMRQASKKATYRPLNAIFCPSVS